MQLLATYVREHADRYPTCMPLPPVNQPGPLRADVHAALDAILSRNVTFDPPGMRIELGGLSPRGRLVLAAYKRHDPGNLAGANLRSVLIWNGLFVHTDFQGAHFDGAYLAHTILREGNLTDATFGAAAVLYHVDLEGTRLDRTDFEGTDLQTAVRINPASLLAAKYRFPAWQAREGGYEYRTPTLLPQILVQALPTPPYPSPTPSGTAPPSRPTPTGVPAPRHRRSKCSNLRSPAMYAALHFPNRPTTEPDRLLQDHFLSPPPRLQLE